MKYFLILLISSFCLADGYLKDGGFAIVDESEFLKVLDAQTTDDTETIIYTMAMPDPSAWFVKSYCDGRKSDGSKREGFIKTVFVYRSGGGATIGHSIVDSFPQADFSYAVTFGVSSNDLQIKVTGATSDTVDWKCTVVKQKLK